MSLVQWLKKERSYRLPFADSEGTSSTNREVEKAVFVRMSTQKQGAYIHYSNKLRVKCACENGSKPTATKFSLELGNKVSESLLKFDRPWTKAEHFMM